MRVSRSIYLVKPPSAVQLEQLAVGRISGLKPCIWFLKIQEFWRFFDYSCVTNLNPKLEMFGSSVNGWNYGQHKEYFFYINQGSLVLKPFHDLSLKICGSWSIRIHGSGQSTVCPGSSDPFYVVTYNIKWVTTCQTYCICLKSELIYNEQHTLQFFFITFYSSLLL